MTSKIAPIIVLAVILPIVTQSQDKDGSVIPLDHFYAKRKPVGFIRKMLANITLGANIGYGNTFFSHQLTGLGIYQLPGVNPQIFDGNTSTRYDNWVNDPSVDKSPPLNTAFISNPGVANIGFKGNGLNIPIGFFLYYGFNRLRIGVGYTYESMKIGTLSPATLGNKINTLQLNNPSGFVQKYYALLGVSLGRYENYIFTGDAHIGNFKPTGNYVSTVNEGFYFNLGVTVDREFSEYFKVFVRPSFEIKNYIMPLPESNKVIENGMNAFYLSVGVTYRVPELPRCFKTDCHTQINHLHGNKEYRSRVHPFYKKQNPGYGENDNTLIKYLGKNKRKLNPY